MVCAVVCCVSERLSSFLSSYYFQALAVLCVRGSLPSLLEREEKTEASSAGGNAVEVSVQQKQGVSEASTSWGFGGDGSRSSFFPSSPLVRVMGGLGFALFLVLFVYALGKKRAQGGKQSAQASSFLHASAAPTSASLSKYLQPPMHWGVKNDKAQILLGTAAGNDSEEWRAHAMGDSSN